MTGRVREAALDELRVRVRGLEDAERTLAAARAARDQAIADAVAAGLSQREAGEEAGISQQAVQQILAGR